MMRKFKVLVMLGAFALVGTAAQAAIVDGSFMIDRGFGYAIATGQVQANPGDRVVVGPNGVANIIYLDGCSIPVEVGTVETVLAESPCGKAALGPSLTATQIGVGALVIGGGIAGIIAITNKSSDKPMSP